MTDRAPLHGLADDDLGRTLAGLDLAWPAAVEGADDVLAAIRAGATGRTDRRRRRRIVLLVAAAILLLATAAIAARYVLRVGAITIEPAPTGQPLPTATELPDLGTPVPLARAEALTGTLASVPAALGPPDVVWVDAPEDRPPDAAATRIVMAWASSPDLPAIPGSPYGAVLIRWDAHVAVGVKLVGQDIDHVDVRGWDEAYWVSDPHELMLATDDGPVHLLVRGHVLLWGNETTTYRLETALPRRDAIAIANTTP